MAISRLRISDMVILVVPPIITLPDILFAILYRTPPYQRKLFKRKLFKRQTSPFHVTFKKGAARPTIACSWRHKSLALAANAASYAALGGLSLGMEPFELPSREHKSSGGH
jgi:hypothetical protein